MQSNKPANPNCSNNFQLVNLCLLMSLFFFIKSGVSIVAAIINLKNVAVKGSMVERIPIKAIGKTPHKLAVTIAKSNPFFLLFATEFMI